MAYSCGTASFGSTGLQTITTGFLPIYVRATVGALFSGTDTDAHLSIGSGTASIYRVNSFFNDGVNIETKSISSKLIHHMEFDGVNIVPVLEGTINSFNATNFKVNMTTATANYQIFFEAFA